MVLNPSFPEKREEAVINKKYLRSLIKPIAPIID